MQTQQGRRRGGGINDINITPFVDVVLVLLVIFMVTAPMVMNRAIKVNLPNAKSATSPAESKTLGITISAKGEFLVNGKLVLEDQLLEVAEAALASNPAVQALLAADVRVEHGRVIKAIDIVRQAGIEKFAFQIAEDE
ncbi:MAG: biopolymer transporter ExbD [Pseudomonadota bacterium]